jgi:hypothetical protein
MFRKSSLACVSLSVLLLGACSEPSQLAGANNDVIPASAITTESEPLNQSFSDLSWSKCIFELDKIEALRGRNLDDLDAGYTSARNQFLTDCMAANDAAREFKHLDEMSRYLAGREKRKPNEMTLNSGDRSLPDETGERIKRVQERELSQESK